MSSSRHSAFHSGGGEMGARVRAHDWAATPLGPVSGWPAVLRVAVDQMLASKFPTCLCWGPDLITLYNDRYRPILGAKPEALGRPFREVWHEVWPQLEPIALRALAGESTFIENYPMETDRHGRLERAHFTFNYGPVFDEHGEVVGMLDTVVETTESVAARQALLDLNADLERRVVERTLVRGRTWQVSPEMMCVVGADGCFETANPAWQRTLGWTEAELTSRPFRDFVHPDDLVRTAEAWAELVEKGLPVLRFENRYRTRGGDWRWLSWTAVPEDEKVYCVTRDVTAERERAAALAEAQEALRQSQKMEAVGQLTGGIAHDFNNLLAAISASLQMVQSRLASGRIEGIDRYVEIGRNSVKRAASLTQRLLAFSRRQTLDPKPTDLNRLVRGMTELLVRTVGPGVAITVDETEPLWPVRVDPSQLENALLNLCLNARDAMPAGGRLALGTRHETLDARAADACGLPAGDYVGLSVADTGVGMPPEVRARIFEPFFTTKPLGQGTGLGLSMVYGFVRQSGGRIDVVSELGRGTRFDMLLPRHDGEPPLPDEPPAERTTSGEGAHDGEVVLLVEDEASVREVLRDVLAEAGYAVICAEDGTVGLRQLQSPGRIDLLVSDVGLPGGLNGRQLADAGRVGRPALRVLFITGYAESVAVGNGLMEEGMEVLIKPFEIAVFTARVRALLDRR